MSRKVIHILLALTSVLWLASCSVYKYVPEGQYLLGKVEVTSDDKTVSDVSRYKNLSYQVPNSRWFGLIRFPLRMYSMSGTRTGEAPVIYDQLLSEATRVDMKRSLMNSGYLNADASYSIKKGRRPKTTVRFKLHPGKMFTVDTIRITVQDSVIERIINENSKQSLLVKQGLRRNKKRVNI